jgi:hypothetical protein
MNKKQQKDLLKEIMDADARDGLYEPTVSKMETTQTAVEWLFLMLNNPNRDQEFANKILEKAKAMEKEQIIQAHNYGEYFSQFRDCLDDEHGKQYYNQTYTHSINNSK